MSARTRSDTNTNSADDGQPILPQLISTVVEIASKSAESSTAAAKAIQTLERTAASVSAEVSATKTEVLLLKQKSDVLEAHIKVLTQAHNQGMIQAFADAVRNPQTLLIIVALIAAVLGLRLTLPGLPVQVTATTQGAQQP